MNTARIMIVVAALMLSGCESTQSVLDCIGDAFEPATSVETPTSATVTR